MDPASAAIIAGGALLGNIWSTSSTNSANMQLAKYQNEWNLAQWHRENEYNSPKATMTRLVEAGLNPRTIEDVQGFANAANSPQAAEMKYQPYDLSGIKDIAQFAMSAQKLQSDIDTNNSIQDKNIAQANEAQAKADEATSNAMKNVADIHGKRADTLHKWANHQEHMYNNGIKVSRYDSKTDTYGQPRYQPVHDYTDQLVFQNKSNLQGATLSETQKSLMYQNILRRLENEKAQDHNEFREKYGFESPESIAKTIIDGVGTVLSGVLPLGRVIKGIGGLIKFKGR